ncbi:hypothetical protein HOK76_07500 [archaeon]|jgi:hypothetical protein|nr:hypothetical protein [archaeon]MBT4647218.1 hypothetical protein [archaeon]MBT5424316.1 hypothetical protein [archaeon]
MKVTLTNPILDLKQKDYEEVLLASINGLRRSQDIVSIYQLGEISSPGSSDLDLIVITKNIISDSEKIINIEKELLNKYSKIYLHGFWYVNEALFKDIHWILPAFNLKHRYGKKINLNEKNKVMDFLHFNNVMVDSAFIPYLIYLIKKGKTRLNKLQEIMSIFFPHTMEKIHIPKNVDQRNILNRMHSIKYQIYVLEKIKIGEGNEKILQAKKFLNKVKNARSNWPNQSNKSSTILSLLDEHYNCSLEMIELFNNFFLNKVCSVNDIEKIVLVNYPRNNLFVKNWDKKNHFKITKNLYNQTGRIVSIFPINYLVQLLISPNISNFIKKRMLNEISIKHKYTKEIKKMYSILKKYNKFTKQTNLPNVPLRKMLTVNPKTKIINQIISSNLKRNS